MKISVVIPTYNAAATIVATIQSIVVQSLAAYEIIVVDDCSTDKSMELVRKHFKEEVTLIPLSTNSGPSKARNVGWDFASGDYVAFIDSDDQWHPEKLAICAATIQAKPFIELLWHPYQTDSLPTYQTQETIPEITGTKLISLMVSNPVSSSAIVLKNIPELRFDENMRYCEDYKLALLTAYRGNAFKLPMMLTQIGRPVLSKGGLSDQKLKMRMGEIRCYWYATQLEPFYLLLFPFLLLWSTAKHITALLKR